MGLNGWRDGRTGWEMAAVEGDVELVVCAGGAVEGNQGVVCSGLEGSCADQSQGGSETAGC